MSHCIEEFGLWISRRVRHMIPPWWCSEVADNKHRANPLTQVYNRRYVLERAEAELLRARRYGGAFSILLLDIDHFKQVNDTHGHLAGDAVLRAVSNLFHGQVRPTDVVGRYGGEEFLVLLPETYHTEACEVAERFRKSLAAAMVVTYEQVKLQITASIGVAL